MGGRSSRPARRVVRRVNPCCSSRNHWRSLSNRNRRQASRYRSIANSKSNQIRGLNRSISNKNGTISFLRNRLRRVASETAAERRRRLRAEQREGDIRTKYIILKKTSLDSGSAKKKAKEVFSMLENQLISKYKLIKTQQNLMSNQNSILGEGEKQSEDKTEEMVKKQAQLHTKKRKMHYDENEYRGVDYVFKIFKLILILLAALVIFFIYKKNLSN